MKGQAGFDPETARRKLEAEFSSYFVPGRSWDSILALKIVFFCEKEFRVSFKAADLNLANFGSIEAVVELVRKRLGD